jgi:hypothetical protein
VQRFLFMNGTCRVKVKVITMKPLRLMTLSLAETVVAIEYHL